MEFLHMVIIDLVEYLYKLIVSHFSLDIVYFDKKDPIFLPPKIQII